MSNPYESPAVLSTSETPPARISAPVWLIVIAILSILLALLGLFGTCVGGLQTIVNLGTDVADPDTPEQKLVAAQKPYLPILLPLMALGVVMYAMMLAGAIGSFKRGSAWAHPVFKYALFGAAVLYLVGGIINYFVQSATLDVMVEMVEAQQQGNTPFDMKPFMQLIVVFTLVVGLGFTCFAFVSALYLQKSKRVKEYLAVKR